MTTRAIAVLMLVGGCGSGDGSTSGDAAACTFAEIEGRPCVAFYPFNETQVPYEMEGEWIVDIASGYDVQVPDGGIQGGEGEGLQLRLCFEFADDGLRAPLRARAAIDAACGVADIGMGQWNFDTLDPLTARMQFGVVDLAQCDAPTVRICEIRLDIQNGEVAGEVTGSTFADLRFCDGSRADVAAAHVVSFQRATIGSCPSFPAE